MIGVVAAVVVGVAFVVAGASKLSAPGVWSASARDMGAPPLVVPVLPWVEMAVGASLAVQVATPVPAAAAIVLLAAFTALIGIRLAAGDRPTCACFGAWSAQPLGVRHVVRNLALLGLVVVSLV